MTAYGLAQFNDMKNVVDYVDDEMIKRNYDWLMDQRDGEGGFNLNPKALDSFGRSMKDITEAYIVWSLIMTKKSQVKTVNYSDWAKELEKITVTAEKTNDPYIMALLSGALYNVDKKDEAKKISQKLATMQVKDVDSDQFGSVQKAESSITNSRGKALILETTALSIINWIS